MISRICISFTLFSVLSISHASEVTRLGYCHYALSVKTTASSQSIWRLWEDVKDWKDYDTILEYSYLENNAPFEVGATGFVKARGAPKTKFELIEVNSGTSFVESLKLPLFSSLLLKRRVKSINLGVTVFTHEVVFKGPAKHLMCLIMGGTFKNELPRVMFNLRDLAELREKERREKELENTSH